MYKHNNYTNTSAPIVDAYDLLYLHPVSKYTIPNKVLLSIDEAFKSNCYDLCPELSSHDNVWFWIGFNKAVEIIKEAYHKK